MNVQHRPRPCNLQHLMGATCDCLACGWHVTDAEPVTEADTWVTYDTGCLNDRPRADQYLDSPRGRRRGELPPGQRTHARRAADIERLSPAQDFADPMGDPRGSQEGA